MAVVAAVLALAPGGVTAAASAQGKPTAHRTPATQGTQTTAGKPPATHMKKPTKPALPPAKTHVRVIVTTANLHQALAPQDQLPFSSTPPQVPVVQVSEATQYQRMKGVGGAMTDTSAWLMYDQLAPGLRAFLMRRLFGHNGLRLRFIRIPIGASDFTATGVPYTYDDVALGDTDPTLADFSIAHDAAYVLPALKQALSVNPHAWVVATPWSPPAWMKTNDQLGNPRNDPGFLREVDYAAMAQYLVKFLQAYASAGVHVSAITPQNEPGIHTTYPGMTMGPGQEGQFVADALAPALRAANLKTEIYGYDSNWATVSQHFAISVANGPAAPDLTGMSTHCYSGEPTFMSLLHDKNPNLDEIVSECAMGLHRLGFTTSEVEISSFRNWASALNLWNIALDPQGGPVQPPNDGCRSCTGLVTISGPHTVSYTRDFYQLGQFSKYVQPGAVRIASNNFVTYTTSPTGNIASSGLDDVAFQNPNHSRVLLAYDNSAVPIKFAVEDQNYFFTYKLQPGETGTFIWYSPVTGKPVVRVTRQRG